MIVHGYPDKKAYQKYPVRYTQETFDKYKSMMNSRTFLQDYEKWKHGISYKSGRKVKIGSIRHNELKEKFIIKGKCESGNYFVMFNQLHFIVPEIYNAATIEINKKVDENNKQIIEYNNQVDEIIEQINKLDNWDSYVVFNDVKYGLPPVLNNMHMTGNCLGEIRQIYNLCRCNLCENWSCCNNPIIPCFICQRCNTTF